MASRERTIVVIAHRVSRRRLLEDFRTSSFPCVSHIFSVLQLSTIRNADRIAFISDGRVKEIGSHDELMEKPKGKYRRLVESQGRNASTVMHGLQVPKKKKKKKKGAKGDDTDDEEDDEKVDITKETEEEEASSFSMARARKMAGPDTFFLLAGSLGALIAGSVFPMWGLLFAGTYTSMQMGLKLQCYRLAQAYLQLLFRL